MPEGTVLNLRHPAPERTLGDGQPRRGHRVGALALAVRARRGAMLVPVGVFGAADPKSGRRFVFYESYCGGWAAVNPRTAPTP